MFGFVTSVHAVDNKFMCTVITAIGRRVVLSDIKNVPGAWIEFSGKEKRIDADTIEVDADSVDNVSDSISDAEKDKVEKFIMKNCSLRKAQPMVDDEVTRALSEKFDAAAIAIKRAVFIHRPIIIRYDDDPDGLCAALIMYSALSEEYNLHIVSNPFPYYKRINADDDIRYFNSLEAEHLPPLLICMDFGSNPESREGYELVKDEGFSLIVIDHHPMQDTSMPELMNVFVSPCAVTSGISLPYTSGFLSSEIAKRISDADVDLLARVAMTFDRSRLIKPTARELKYAEALEFILITSKYEQTIESLHRVVNDEETIDFAYAQAEENIQTLLEKLPSKTKKKTFNGVSFFLIDTGRLWVKGKFPGKTAIANIASDYLIERLQEPAVSITYGGRGLSVRMNKIALKRGLDSSLAIKSVKSQLPDAVEAGGGHPVAAAMRVKVGYIKIVMDALVKEIGGQIK